MARTKRKKEPRRRQGQRNGDNRARTNKIQGQSEKAGKLEMDSCKREMEARRECNVGSDCICLILPQRQGKSRGARDPEAQRQSARGDFTKSGARAPRSLGWAAGGSGQAAVGKWRQQWRQKLRLFKVPSHGSKWTQRSGDLKFCSVVCCFVVL